jgi:Uma2 family endonuclease
MTAITADFVQANGVQARPLPPQHLFLSNVSWDGYIAIGKALSDRASLRITYDRGSIELMTTSREHEVYKKWLGRFVEIIAEELHRLIAPGGNMTMQREDLQRGLEGDDIFWVEHEAQMRRKLTWDPYVDPPPDLALEIEVSRSVLDRLAIYAALKVPEVWSFDGSQLHIRCLDANGVYQLSETSRAFPEVPLAEIVRFLAPEQRSDYLSAMQEFRVWLQQLLGKS